MCQYSNAYTANISPSVAVTIIIVTTELTDLYISSIYNCTPYHEQNQRLSTHSRSHRLRYPQWYLHTSPMLMYHMDVAYFNANHRGNSQAT